MNYIPKNILKSGYYLRELWFLKEESNQKLDLIFLYYLRKEENSSYTPDQLDFAIQHCVEQQMHAQVNILSNAILYSIDRDRFEKRLREYTKSNKQLELEINFQEDNITYCQYVTKMYLYSPDDVIWNIIWPQKCRQVNYPCSPQIKDILKNPNDTIVDIKSLLTAK